MATKKTKTTKPAAKKLAKPVAKKAPPPPAKKVAKKVAPAPPTPALPPPPPPKVSAKLRTTGTGPNVDDYMTKVAPWQRAIIEKLREVVVTAAPHATESIKWGQPVYEHKGPFSYIKAHAAQVNFGFWRGAELEDPKRMLQGEGERMRHVKIIENHIIDDVSLVALVKQAVSLNDKKGDPTKG